jgi:single-stranded-DNA-specific exonuclease
MHTHGGYSLRILSPDALPSLESVMAKNRPYASTEAFFAPTLADLHDPYLMPDMDKAVARILIAREAKERIVIFGDYDVDGVSSTAILVRFLTEIGCEVSYRLPHRVHDGYGLKAYFFDELATKWVTLVITVDCGTRDIEPIRHAKSLGIDVIVTDHHAVPDIVPEEVIAIVNPKRRDSLYPFPDLAGAGVAFKLLHAVAIRIQNSKLKIKNDGTNPESWILNLESILTRYIDFASLGTVSDCMPIIGENRVITALGLVQMQNSSSSGLRKFLAWRDKITESDADLIGFQIGPRINAAGRMDTPLTALRWLLASEGRTDEYFAELEYLNETRKGNTATQFEKALEHVDTTLPILFYDASDLEHGIIGLVAGKLTEMYGKPSIIIKNWHDHPLTRRKWDEIEVDDSVVSTHPTIIPSSHPTTSIASCRSPEWCSMIELLDSAKDLFVRYGGHRQAAGFTIEEAKIPELKRRLLEKFATLHDIANLPKRVLDIECILDVARDITIANLDTIDRFRPFGIGNRKPLFILENVTVASTRPLGSEWKHLAITLAENPTLKLLLWNATDRLAHFAVGNVVSLVVDLDRNEWKEKVSVQVVVRDIVV